MKIFNNIWNAINANSDVNLDLNIEFYKKYVVFYERFTPELEDLENSLKKANGINKKKLKIKFKNILQEIYEELDFDLKKDIYDRAW
ncbi:hypothetical protein [Chryseobacterium sp. S90]|uniref:hypothetical protein n=1 Tax=Chryseobacterium sp. S90 TaxID=3395373 RepID=UPI0039BC5210